MKYIPQARCVLGILPRSAEGSNADDYLRLESVEPRSFTVNMQDLQTANEFDIDFDLDLVPLDPREIRAMYVDLLFGPVESPDDVLEVNDQNRLIVGQVDELNTKLKNDGDVVSVTGRDYTGLLLDEKWLNRRVELGRPITTIIRELLDSYPAASNLIVEHRFEGSAPVVPAGAGERGRYFTADHRDALLEGMQQLARFVSAQVVVQHDRVVVQPPRTTTEGDQVLAVEAAKGLTDLDVLRKLGGEDIPNIRVKANDPETFGTVVGEWPQPPEPEPKVVKAGEESSSETEITWQEYDIQHPAPTESILDDIAKGVWENMAQQQLEVSLETKHLRFDGYQAGRSFEDTLEPMRHQSSDVRNGTRIRVIVDRDTRQVLRRANNKTEAILELQRRQFSYRVAQSLARGFDELDVLLFTDTATHSYSQGEGYSLSVDAINAIEVDIG